MPTKKNSDKKPSLKIKDLRPNADPQGGAQGWPSKLTGQATTSSTTEIGFPACDAGSKDATKLTK